MTSLFGARRKRRKTLILAEIVFLLTGFVCLIWAGYMTAQSIAANSWDSYRFEETLSGNQPTVWGYATYLWKGDKATPHAEGEEPAMEEPPAPKAAPSPPARSARKYRRSELIGRIEMPRLKVAAVLKEGTDTKTLSRAVGHVPYTALPGEKGNVGVAAHRDTYFRGLRNVRHGDVIHVTTEDGVYMYEVDSLKIVWPKNVEVLDPTPDKRITLVTCYPFNYVGSAPKRFIVQGKQVGFEELSARGKAGSEQASAASADKSGS